MSTPKKAPKKVTVRVGSQRVTIVEDKNKQIKIYKEDDCDRRKMEWIATL